MKLAVDNDFFCKSEVLGVAGLIRDALGTIVNDCYVLPELLHQLRRGSGKLWKAYASHAGMLARQAELHPQLPDEWTKWIDSVGAVDEIDPGEAQLLAYVAAAEDVVLMATHDKRCVKAISKVPGLASALEGKILLLESALLCACDRIGAAALVQTVTPNLRACNDNAMRACFGSGREASVVEALERYLGEMRDSAAAGILWTPARL